MSSIGKTRNTLYKTTRIVGVIQAMAQGRVEERIIRRFVGKAIVRPRIQVLREIASVKKDYGLN